MIYEIKSITNVVRKMFNNLTIIQCNTINNTNHNNTNSVSNYHAKAMVV